MTSLELIKGTLPTWPDDVIDQWLLPHSMREGFGWPPPDQIESSDWQYVLRYPIAFWKAVTWSFEEMELDNAQLTDDVKARLYDMRDGYFGDAPNLYALTIPNGKDRVRRVLAFLAKNGCLPRHPVGIRVGNQIDLMDGNHRVLAWHLYRNGERDDDWLPPPEKAGIWIATFPGAEP